MKENPFNYSIATRVRDKFLLKFLRLAGGESLLDLGCGIGYFTELLSLKNAQVIGIDIDTKAILYAKQNTSGNKFLIASAEALPFKENSFDKLLCSEVLEHIENDEQAVSEIYRVCKSDAIVVITVPTEEGCFGSKIKKIGHEDAEGGERHYRDGYTRFALESLLKCNGIIPVKSQYSMVFFTELFMGLTKIGYLIKGKKMQSQTDVLKVKDSLFFRFYKFTIFPLVLFLSRIEDFLLAKMLKGHMLITVGIVKKGT